MSADSDISTLLSHATSAASSLASDSSNLVSQATTALVEEVEFLGGSTASATSYGVTNRGGGFFGPFFGTDGYVGVEGSGGAGNRHITDDPPPAFPVFPEVNLGTPPNTQELDEVALDVDYLDFPTLTFPTFKYPHVAGVPTFSKTVPAVGTKPAMPPPPNADAVFEPQFLDLTAVDPVTLSVAPPEFAPIDTEIEFDPTLYATALNRFQNSILGGSGGVPGLNELLDEVTTWAQTALDAVLPAALTVLSARMADKQAAVLGFHADLRDRLTERLDTEKNRVIATLGDRSGWEWPHSVQVAREAMIGRLANAWAEQAESQADTQTAELALAFFETCGALLTRFTTGVQKLKTQEIAQTLEAHKAAIAYAKATLAALLAQYEAETFLTQDTEFQKAEAQLKVFEAEITVALFQYEMARANLEVESAQQDVDAARIQTLKAEVSQSQNAVRRYAALVGAARKEVELRRFAVEQFELQVKAYGAQINAHEARVSAQVAEIDGDTARVEGQLKKLEGFESEMRGFLQLIETKRLRAEAQSARNAAVIEEYEQRTKSALAKIDQSALENAHALKQYEVQVNNLLADAKLGRQSAKLELEFRIKKLEGELDAYRLTQERNVELMKTELARLKAIAEINGQGANIMASMAQGAMSAANGIVAAIFSEAA